MSGSVWPHRQQPTRLPCEWDSPGKNTGVSCHSLFPMHESEKWKWSHSVVSNSFQPLGLQPTRLLHLWDFPGKSTGVGCYCLLHDQPRQHVKNWRHYFVHKGPSSQSYDFSSSHVWMWELDYNAKELMLLNYNVGEDSWESLGLQGDPINAS